MSVSFLPKRGWCVLLAIVGIFASDRLWAQGIAPSTPEQKLTAAIDVLQQLDAGEDEVEVIVNLAPPAGKPGKGEWDSRPRLRGWQRALAARRDEVFTELAPDDFKPRHFFENQPGFSGRVTRKGLEKLARHPRVLSIEYSRPVRPQLKQGLPLMNALSSRSNYGGAGVAIAIVDSGIDYRHPYLGGTTNFPNGKVIGGYDLGDSDPIPLASGNGAHGTACAGIAAGNVNTNDTGDYIGGVAPQAKLYALKITAGATEGANDADIIAAWNWCITHKNDDPNNPILVISTSFGGGRHNQVCDADSIGYAVAAANAVSAGISVVVSSGNDGFCDSLIMPACISSVTAVGAVYDAGYASATYCVNRDSCVAVPSGLCAGTGYSTTDLPAVDKVARYSNTSDFLALLAPAHRAHVPDIIGGDGYSPDSYILGFGGTSAAAPYAAGAIAALQSATKAKLNRHLTPAEARALLTSAGDPLSDPKATHIVKPRVNLGRAIEELTPPRLAATRANNRIVISWPTNATGYVLEWAHALPATTWSNVPAIPVTVGTNQYYTNVVTPSAKKFYRLRK